MRRKKTGVLLGACALGLAIVAAAQSQSAPMTCFVSSVGSGPGGDLGGLEGADRHCQSLATAAGAGTRTWRAYLSTQGAGAVNARDRIGTGPWHNASGVPIARTVDELHMGSNINRETALTEKGERVPGRLDVPPGPNRHDILTGSRSDGTAFPDGEDRTCRNWTSSTEGRAMVGHHDRMGLRDDEPSRSWNASHPSAGCSQPELVKTGGAGLFYCFAAK
ncbi:MAG: lectin [Pseudomonadota bacterium]